MASAAPTVSPRRLTAERSVTAIARLGHWAFLMLPGALTVYVSFNAGGYFPNTEAFVALVLAAALVLRIAFSAAPFAGYGSRVLAAAAALGAFAAWTALSGAWSDAPGPALLEFDRALLYLLALLLCAAPSRDAAATRWMLRGVWAALVVVCGCALVTRVLPDVWPIGATFDDGRLSYPITYWNALGLMAAVGTIFSFHFASSRSEPPWMRVLGAAAVPMLAATVFFTFSRGAIAAGTVGLLVYVIVARPRALVGGVLATVPAAAISIIAAYNADLLAGTNPTSAAAADQGQEVALVVGVCIATAALLRFLLLRVDARLRFATLPARARRGLAVTAALLGVGAIAVLVAVSAPDYVSDQYDRFVHSGGAGSNPGDLRTRLTDPSNNGRIETWTVAVDAFQDKPVSGTGAASFENLWTRDRKVAFSVRDAHSLYLEVLGELGVVGFGLLMAALFTILGGLARRARGRDRTLYAAILAAAVTWALHAGIDWDWEMPATTLWVFALGGAALAAADGDRASRSTGQLARLAAIAGCFAVAIVPAAILISDNRLEHSAGAFERGDCREAADAAASSISAFPLRAAPYEVRAFCRLRARRTAAGIRDLERAVDREPDRWTYHYDLALARGSAGLDPRGEARTALRLNPLRAESRAAVRRFRTSTPRRWRRVARALLDGTAPFYLSAR